MEKLLKNKWLMVVFGAVVLFIVYKRFGGHIQCALDPKCSLGSKETAGAYGSNYGLSNLNASGVTAPGKCRPGYSHASCQQACETHYGGTYNQDDRRCYVNGQAVTGGIFGGKVLRSRRSIM